MALTPDNVDVALNGKVLVAAVGTTMPTDVTSAWDAAFTELGYLDDNGVEVDPSLSMNDISAWQDLNPVRSVPKSATHTFKFTCLETSPGVLGLFLPSASITKAGGVATIAVPSIPDTDYRAFGFEWTDGAKTNRILLPKGLVTARNALTLTRGSAQSYQLTVTAYSNGGSDIYTWLSDNPSMTA